MRALYEWFTQPVVALLVIAAVSLISIISAFVAQYGFDLQPCILCIWQRWPHGIAAALGIVYLLISRNPYSAMVPLFLGYMIVLHLAGTGIAAFHVGVEQKWWVGTPSCGVPAIDPNNLEAIRELINSKTVSCDDPQWFLFGITMAGYNAMLSLGLAIYGALSLLKGLRQSRGV